MARRLAVVLVVAGVLAGAGGAWGANWHRPVREMQPLLTKGAAKRAINKSNSGGTRFRWCHRIRRDAVRCFDSTSMAVVLGPGWWMHGTDTAVLGLHGTAVTTGSGYLTDSLAG